MAPTLPNLRFGLEMSEVLHGVLVTGRWWNKFAREAMQEVLNTHFETRIPQHFRITAKSKYGYKPRKGITKKLKKSRWHISPDLDLVRSGQTSRYVMSSARITLRGSFGADQRQGAGISGRLTMHLPFPQSRDGRPGSVQQKDMKDEITRTTPDEDRAIREQFRDLLIEKLQSHAGRTVGYKHT